MSVIIGKNIFFDLKEGQKRIIDFCKKEKCYVVTTSDGKDYSFDKKFLADFENGEVIDNKFRLLVRVSLVKDFLPFCGKVKIAKSIEDVEESIENWEL